MAITAMGLGWSLALLSGGLLVRVAHAPAFGVALACLAGVVADRSGFRLASGTALAVGLAVMAVGWAAVGLRHAVGRRAGGNAVAGS